MIRGVRDFYYNVEDMNRAVAFYRDVLGFRVVHGDEWWTSLDLAGAHVGLHGTDGAALPPIERDAHGAQHGGTLTLLTDDITEDVSRLRAGGVVFLDEISRNPWGDVVAFLDSEGNVLKLMQPPAGE